MEVAVAEVVAKRASVARQSSLLAWAITPTVRRSAIAAAAPPRSGFSVARSRRGPLWGRRFSSELSAYSCPGIAAAPLRLGGFMWTVVLAADGSWHWYVGLPPLQLEEPSPDAPAVQEFLASLAQLEEENHCLYTPPTTSPFTSPPVGVACSPPQLASILTTSSSLPRQRSREWKDYPDLERRWDFTKSLNGWLLQCLKFQSLESFPPSPNGEDSDESDPQP